MAEFAGRTRRLVPGVVTLLIAALLFAVSQNAVAVPEGDGIAAQYRFREMPIAMPPGYEDREMKSIREVNPAYFRIRSWVSSVGAGIALNDLTGSGRASSLCIVDPRTDEVIVTYAPNAPQEDRFDPFLLDPAPLPAGRAMAPTGCTPGDYNVDGRTDLLVTYWGRTPVLHLAKADADEVAPESYKPQELVPQVTVDGEYHGPKWHTNAVTVGDLAGNGRPDIIIGNYFPDSDVLDPLGQNNVEMNDSLSRALNGGGSHVLRWEAGTAGADPTASYSQEVDAIPHLAANGWTLGLSNADMTGDGRPEVYVANDFGHDFMLHNTSTEDGIMFTAVKGERTPTTPKSFIVGNDSFKGMGVDFGDVDRNGSFDMAVSNITTAWGLEESHFLWVNDAETPERMGEAMDRGVADFTQRAQELGTAWSGWGWDIKMGDFANTGNLDVVQTTGFVKGDIDRWPWLQELAMSNDMLVSNPAMWPNMQPGDDISGHEAPAFFARGRDHDQFVNITGELGLGVHHPSRGVATGDTNRTGALDLAIARQWGPPSFYANESPDRGGHLTLHLYRPVRGAESGLSGPGTPVYGATVEVSTPDGRKQVSRLDGGSGHGGKRSFDVHFGFGDYTGPVSARVSWRDLDGRPHEQTAQLQQGDRTLVLTSTAQEVPGR
ncbi:ASPIC/UnbV domain-containing protein [Saccharothrix sp. Mg75]|uniref:ASPIC/UnbV domain-containing protein n=1 Tax=Saccharothrix sp. Mg75 TaxID=3445357 RepID=UPI003EE9FC29